MEWKREESKRMGKGKVGKVRVMERGEERMDTGVRMVELYGRGIGGAKK